VSDVFESLESEVRSYCRNWPTVFDRAEGSFMYSEDGREYLDFFAGAGVVSYGHSHPVLKAALIDYIERDGLTHGLDMATVAKREFLIAFDEIVLKPRGMEYRVQFPGPGGANAVESALKLARRATGRDGIVSFTAGFHGMTLGALSVSGNHRARTAAGVTLHNVTPMPFDGFLGPQHDALDMLRQYLDSSNSGVDLPAAIILESVQAEGGVNVASVDWLQGVQAIAREHGILLIVDDIQVGCGRCGTFFSFEEAGIDPDIICLSKALSGYGLPMAVTLVRPEYDVLQAGEHNGTFRGLNLAFVTAKAALETYWRDTALAEHVGQQALRVHTRLSAIAAERPHLMPSVRGRGLIYGLDFGIGGLATDISNVAFEAGLVIETCGPGDRVLKILPPLVITREELDRGLDIIEASIDAVTGLGGTAPHRVAAA
jgi:diaminobutyrate-2-oxoglutarate transaminase